MNRTLEREPVGEAGQPIVACLALDPLVQHASTKTRRELFGEVLETHDVIASEPLTCTGPAANHEQADDAGPVTDRSDHDLDDRRPVGLERVEFVARHQRHPFRHDQRSPVLVLGVCGQMQPDDAVDPQNRPVAVAEEDDGDGVGAKNFSGLGNSGTDDLVGIERLADLAGEPMDRVEVTQTLIERAVGLDDVPDHTERDECHQYEVRRNQVEPQHHAGEGRIHEEQPPGDTELAADTAPEPALELRDRQRHDDRRHEATDGRRGNRSDNELRVTRTQDGNNPAEYAEGKHDLEREHPDVQHHLVGRQPEQQDKDHEATKHTCSKRGPGGEIHQAEGERNLRQGEPHRLAAKDKIEDCELGQRESDDQERKPPMTATVGSPQ